MNDTAASADATPSTVMDITISGVELQLDTRFDEGHVLTAAEAKQLNQVYAENIGNNFRNRVKELSDGGKTVDEIQAELDAYADKYEFGSRRSGGGKRVGDPILREMRALAKKALAAFVKDKHGTSWNDIDSDQREEMVKKYIAKYEPKLRPIAERRVADAADMASLEA